VLERRAAPEALPDRHQGGAQTLAAAQAQSPGRLERFLHWSPATGVLFQHAAPEHLELAIDRVADDGQEHGERFGHELAPAWRGAGSGPAATPPSRLTLHWMKWRRVSLRRRMMGLAVHWIDARANLMPMGRE